MCGCFMYNNVPLNIPTYNFPTLKRTFQVHQHRIFLKHIVIHTYTHCIQNISKGWKGGKASLRYQLQRPFRQQNQNNIEFCSEFN